MSGIHELGGTPILWMVAAWRANMSKWEENEYALLKVLMWGMGKRNGEKKNGRLMCCYHHSYKDSSPYLDMQIASQDTVSREFWLNIWKIMEPQIALDLTLMLGKGS